MITMWGGIQYYLCGLQKRIHWGNSSDTTHKVLGAHSQEVQQLSLEDAQMEATIHKCSMQKVKVIEKEDNWFRRRVK
jgi:hypothetical protein